jgi:hypothetical protein
MQQPPYVELPLRNRAGEVVGVALYDEADRALVEDGPAWHLGDDGYVRRQLSIGTPPNRRVWTILMHRLIMGAGPGDPHVDHENRVRHDNRRANLRFATRPEQAQNVTAWGASQYRGVSPKGKKWVAYGRLNGVRHHLGTFDRELQAAHAAQQWRLKNMPRTVEAELPPAPPIEPKTPKPAGPCVNCRRPYKPLRRGRCAACDQYLRKTGVERPYGAEDGRRS